jgi:hypothetical protein
MFGVMAGHDEIRNSAINFDGSFVAAQDDRNGTVFAAGKRPAGKA